MKKVLGIIALTLLLSGNVYAIGCNLKADNLQENYTNGSLEVNVYNPNSTTVIISGIMYYNDDALVRTYKVFHFVGAQSSLNFSHKTSTAFLKVTNAVNFDCTISATRAEKNNFANSLKKKKSGFEWWYLLFIPIVLAVIGWVSEQGEKLKNQSKTKKKKSKETHHLGIKKGSTEGNTIGVVIMVAFIAVCVILILKSNNF